VLCWPDWVQDEKPRLRAVKREAEDKRNGEPFAPPRAQASLSS
jgi:hypothetical protein